MTRKTWIRGAAAALLCLGVMVSSADSYPNGILPQGAAWSVANAAYQSYKSARFVSSGTGNPSTMLRVLGDGGSTVSEGMGYGLLMAAYLEPGPDVVRRLWNYVASHLDAQGLMHWKISGSNQVVGVNAASDGDVDIALALVKAHRRWPDQGFGALARTYIDRILRYETDSTGLKPGDVWGGAGGRNNPSYYSTSYFPVFRAFTGNAAWSAVRDACYRNLEYSRTHYALVPEWTSADTGRIVGGDAYDYNACRTPWRLALDHLWYGDARARSWSDKFTSFFASRGGLAGIRNGYVASTGTATVGYKSSAFVGAVGCAAMASGHAALTRDVFEYLRNANDTSYYHGALKVLYLMTMCGVFTDPLAGGAPVTAVYEAETMFHSVGGPATGGWNLWTNGYVSAAHAFQGGATTIEVVAAGRYAGGAWPRMRVLVGGTIVGEATVSGTSWATYPFNFTTTSGTKELRVVFTNDYYAGGEDRNLLVDKARIRE